MGELATAFPMGEKDAVRAKESNRSSCSDLTYVKPPLTFSLLDLDGSSLSVDRRFPFDLRVDASFLGDEDEDENEALEVEEDAPNPAPEPLLLPPAFLAANNEVVFNEFILILILILILRVLIILLVQEGDTQNA